MWLADLRMGLAKNLEVYRSMHMDGQAHKMVTLQNVDKYAIRRGTSSMQYQRPTFIGFELFYSRTLFFLPWELWQSNLHILHIKLLQHYQPLFFP